MSITQSIQIPPGKGEEYERVLARISHLLSGGGVMAYPTETVIDPTGAGDTFAGGLMGYMASKGNNDEYTFRQSLIYGTLMASFCVEGFGIDRLKKVQEEEIRRRFEEFKEMTVFI